MDSILTSPPFIVQLIDSMRMNVYCLFLYGLPFIPVVLLIAYGLRKKNFPIELKSFVNTSFGHIKDQKNIVYFDTLMSFVNAYGARFKTEGNYYLSPENLFRWLIYNEIDKNQRPSFVIDQSVFPFFIDLNNKDNTNTFLAKHCDPKFINKDPEIDTVYISHNGSGLITINNGKVLRIIIDPSFDGYITIANCWIGSINFSPKMTSSSLTLKLVNTFVGVLNLEPSCCSSLIVTGGGVCHLYCPKFDQPCPVTNTFEITNSILFDDQITTEEDASSYRSLFIFSKRRASILTQQFIGSSIFKYERKNEQLLTKIISSIYQVFSNYNMKPALLLSWILVSFLFCWYISFVSNQFDVSNITYTSLDSTIPISSFNYDTSIRLKNSFIGTWNSLYSSAATLPIDTSLKSKYLIFSLVLAMTKILNMIWIAMLIFSLAIKFGIKSLGFGG